MRSRDVRRMALAGAVPLALTGCASGPPAPPAPAPSASAAPTTSPGPAPVVVLDPGHDGGNAGHAREISRPVPDGRGGTKACNTTGTETDAGYPEHAFTFDVAQRAAQRLEAAGVRVILTRLDDTGVGPCVDERGRAGERAGATAVVSIHADGARPDGHGFHVALAGPPLNTAQGAPAYALATALRDGLHAAGFPPSDYTGRDGIVERPDLAGLNLSTRPAALVECANMRNAAEARVVASPDGRQRYADAIAAGVLVFLGR